MSNITIKEYFATAGSRFTDKDARIIGPVLAELSGQQEIDAAAVVETARSANCPLHAYFEWDDSKAAHMYREGQATEIINTVRVRFVSDDNGQERTVRAYRIAQAKEAPVYTPKYAAYGFDRDITSDAAEQDEIIADALRELQQWRIKYRPYAEQFEAFKDAAAVIMNQISEFMDEFDTSSGAIKPLEAIEDLRLWLEQHGSAPAAAAQFSEQFKYMRQAIDEAERAFDPDAGLESVLARENRLLRERLAELEGGQSDAGESIALQRRMSLTRKEAAVVSILLSRESASTGAILSSLYADRVGSETPDPKIVDVFVHKTRKKLADYGITIDTIWGTGYALTSASKQRIREMLEQPAEAA